MATIMAAFTVVLGLTLVAGTFASVDYNSCSWSYSKWGVYLGCARGHIAVGACGSGSNADCGHNVWNGIKCCKTNMDVTGVPLVYAKGFGVRAECAKSTDIVTAFCGAGGHADCRWNNYWYCTVIMCQATSLKFGTSCHWLWGNYGEHLECPTNYVIKGKCGSGAALDCQNYSAHGIKCCQII